MLRIHIDDIVRYIGPKCDVSNGRTGTVVMIYFPQDRVNHGVEIKVQWHSGPSITHPAQHLRRI